jgi:CyaY protein
MNEAEFNQIVDDLMFSIEESIDNSGADIDYENSAGMLTITCEANGSQIILSRQPAMGEIWLAARSGGFHFKLLDLDRAALVQYPDQRAVVSYADRCLSSPVWGSG